MTWQGRESEEKIEQLREMDSALSEPPVRDAQICLEQKFEKSTKGNGK